MLASAGAGRNVVRNAPYGPEDGVTYTLRRHGLSHTLPNVMIEIRNDLVVSTAQQTQVSDELLAMLRPALARVGVAEVHDA